MKEMENNQWSEQIKKNIISKLEDIKLKVISNEPYPEITQNIDDLSDIDDMLDQILNKWYY